MGFAKLIVINVLAVGAAGTPSWLLGRFLESRGVDEHKIQAARLIELLVSVGLVFAFVQGYFDLIPNMRWYGDY
jgi:hypothetical protein